MHVVEVFVAVDLLVGQGQGVGAMAEGEGQAPGVVVDVAGLARAGVAGVVAVEGGAQGDAVLGSPMSWVTPR